MIITILCSSTGHPINEWLGRWVTKQTQQHSVNLIRAAQELTGGDLLFLISCSEIINREQRGRYGKVLVIHASDLPKGRGWSPHIWDIIHGATEITLSLLEVEDQVDSGSIWKKTRVQILKTDLMQESNTIL